MKITKNSSLKASSIIQRLPFHRQFTKSQSRLTELLPVWLRWSDNNEDDRLSKCCSPIHFSEGILVIECANAVAATQLKQRQKSLMRYFHQQKHTDIKEISVRLAKQSNLRNNENKNAMLSTQARASSATDNFTRHTVNLDSKALDSIKSCQKQVGHQPLSESLGRLINLLESNKLEADKK